MGGLGSGGRNKRKFSVEECKSLDIRRFKREGYLKPGLSFEWAWYRDIEKASSIGIGIKEDFMILSYMVNGHEKIKDPIMIVKTDCNYGSSRPWFECPGCNERAAKLYLVGKYFRCRHCHGLNYTSSQRSGDPFEKIDNRIYKVYGKLKGESKDFNEMLYCIPPKPKNMHYDTYVKLRNEFISLRSRRDRLFATIAMDKFGYVV